MWSAFLGKTAVLSESRIPESSFDCMIPPTSVASTDRRRADLHVHTIHSDGRHSMQEILDDAAQG